MNNPIKFYKEVNMKIEMIPDRYHRFRIKCPKKPSYKSTMYACEECEYFSCKRLNYLYCNIDKINSNYTDTQSGI